MTARARGPASLSRWPERSIPEVLQEVVDRYPERTAIVTPEGDLSYRELGRRVRRVAALLRSSATGAPRHVLLLFDHGAEAIVAMLGVLVAGETYVMLDPGDPQERLELIASDALEGIEGILFTHTRRRAQAERLASGRCPIVALDSLDDRSEAPAESPTGDVPPDRPAYLIYTSGSTGVPKGVIQTHRNLLYFVGCYVERLGIDERDRHSLLFTLSFSASNMDIYGALMSGAALCPYDVHTSGIAGLVRWVDETGITVLHAAPSLFRSMLAAGREPARLSTVRAIDLGGEAVHGGDARLWRARFSEDSVLMNHLGATEASVIGMYAVKRADGAGNANVPAGVQPPGVTLRLVRPDGSRCAPGEEGEILVESPFVSPGYWNRPELTAAAFSHDPARSGWRIYRTRDLGRVDAEGVLWRIGRTDDRVKIRGHLVDLAEVEAVLRDVSQTDEAAVVSIAGATGRDAFLAAYAAKADGDPRAVRQAMRGRLPEYMVPAEVHLLDALPRAATGKIDRRLLSGLDRPLREPRRDLTAPEGIDERAVARAFCAVLGLESVGRDESFFDLGGTSLTATELQLDLREVLRVEITPAALMADATVRGIARAAARQRRVRWRPSSPLIAVREGGSRPPLFLVHGRYLQAFLSPEFARILGDDQPLYVFHGRTGKRAHTRFGPLVTEYLDAIRNVRPEGPYVLGGMCLGAYIAHEMGCRLAAEGEVLAPLLLLDPPCTPPIGASWARLERLARLYAARIRASLVDDWRVDLVRQSLEKRREWTGGLLDLPTAREATRASLSFQIAHMWHRPRVYPHAVRVLSSATRIRKQRHHWRDIVAGDLRFDVVGDEHSAALDPSNPAFVAALRRIQEEALAIAATRPGRGTR